MFKKIFNGIETHKKEKNKKKKTLGFVEQTVNASTKMNNYTKCRFYYENKRNNYLVFC